jgi:hypothetical protein
VAMAFRTAYDRKPRVWIDPRSGMAGSQAARPHRGPSDRGGQAEETLPRSWVPCLRLRKHARALKKTWLRKRSHGTRPARAQAREAISRPLEAVRPGCSVRIARGEG